MNDEGMWQNSNKMKIKNVFIADFLNLCKLKIFSLFSSCCCRMCWICLWWRRTTRYIFKYRRKFATRRPLLVTAMATWGSLAIQYFVLAKMPADTQMKIASHVIRNGVTSAWYLKCNWSESNRFTAIAVIVRKDAMVKKGPNMATAWWKAYIPLIVFAISKGCKRPTARSDTARLLSKIFAAECKEDVFQNVNRTAEFPNSAVKERKALTWHRSWSWN